MTVIPVTPPAVRYCPAQDVRQAANPAIQVDIIRQQRF